MFLLEPTGKAGHQIPGEHLTQDTKSTYVAVNETKNNRQWPARGLQ